MVTVPLEGSPCGNRQGVVCARKDGGYTCGGDSGGPAVADQDGDGTISIAELRVVLGPGGALAEVTGALNNEEIDALISIADQDGDGEIGYEEFVCLVNRMKGGDSEEEMRKAFRYFDIDKDGVISKGDMKEALRRLGKQFNDQTITEIFDDADENGDGMVDYNEFVNILLQMHILTSYWEQVLDLCHFFAMLI